MTPTYQKVQASRIKHIEKTIARLTKLIPHTTDNGAAIRVELTRLNDVLVSLKASVQS